MRHCDIEVAIGWLITNAAAEPRRNLAIYAVRSLAQLDGLADAAEAQLLPHAARTLRAACTDPVHVDVSTLGGWIGEWETALVYREEDTSSVLIAALCGLTSWHLFLRDGACGPIAAMAFTLLDVAGFDHYDAESDTRPLADPHIIDQFRTITELLTETPPRAWCGGAYGSGEPRRLPTTSRLRPGPRRLVRGPGPGDTAIPPGPAG